MEKLVIVVPSLGDDWRARIDSMGELSVRVTYEYTKPFLIRFEENSDQTISPDVGMVISPLRSSLTLFDLINSIFIFSSSSFTVKYERILNAPHKIQPRKDRLKAFFRPNFTINIATNAGPRPFPTSLKTVNNAKALPRRLGNVTFASVAFTIGPVIPAPKPV